MIPSRSSPMSDFKVLYWADIYLRVSRGRSFSLAVGEVSFHHTLIYLMLRDVLLVSKNGSEVWKPRFGAFNVARVMISIVSSLQTAPPSTLYEIFTLSTIAGYFEMV